MMAVGVRAQTAADTPKSQPEATIDLATAEGVKMVKGEWRYSDTKIIEIDVKGPGPDNQPTGAPVKTYDYTPHAGGADFDDSKWQVIEPTTLNARRATGRLCFNWYRINITIPERVENFDPTGSTVVFETALDDYAEIWVDGELSRALGQMGGSVISGWNAPNRLVVGRNVKPGQEIQLTIFGANGPLSNPPTNFIWMRYAKLEFYKNNVPSVPLALTPAEVNVEIIRLDPAMDAIVGPNPKIFKLAEGFKFTEGPVWVRDGKYLLFSDPNSNIIYKYTPDGNNPGKLEVFRTPFGFPKFFNDPRKELSFSGVYSIYKGKLQLLGTELSGPNGIALSPDEKYLYVGNWYDANLYTNGKADEKKVVVMRYEVNADATISKGQIFFDMTGAKGEDAIDGIKVDQQGNLYVSGPGGLWVLSAEGKHLGTIIAPKHPHNMAWGDDDNKTLYLCARSGLYRMRLNIPGSPAITSAMSSR
jgi:sugar lactone lactonase YvrE